MLLQQDRIEHTNSLNYTYTEHMYAQTRTYVVQHVSYMVRAACIRLSHPRAFNDMIRVSVGEMTYKLLALS